MVTTVTAPKNNEITDFESFNKLDPLAVIYFFSLLDGLVDLAHRISHDFISRLELYRGLDPAVTDILGKLYTQYGTDTKFLAPKQRNQIFDSIFGPSGRHEVYVSGSFQPLRDSLLDACARYAANIRLGDNREILNAEVEIALIPFLNYLEGLQGDPVRWIRDRLAEVTTAAYQILQADTVATVFGVTDPPSPTWPFTPDPNGNILVEQTSEKQISRACFSLLQQAAVRGAETIDNVINCNGQVTVELIEKCNSWYSALMKARKTCCEAGLPYICRN